MTVVNHWVELPRWPAGRALYSCYLTFADHPRLHDLIDSYQAALVDLPNMDMILPQWRHMTIQGSAFTDELSAEERHAIEKEVRERLTAVAPVIAHTESEVLVSDSIYIPIRPIEPLADLRATVRAGILAVLDESRLYSLPGQETDEFDPHVSVAYVNADGPAEPIRQRLAQVNPEPIELRITHVSLMSLRNDDHKWSWTDEIRIPLAGER